MASTVPELFPRIHTPDLGAVLAVAICEVRLMGDFGATLNGRAISVNEWRMRALLTS